MADDMEARMYRRLNEHMEAYKKDLLMKFEETACFCESPIERALLADLMWMRTDYNIGPVQMFHGASNGLHPDVVWPGLQEFEIAVVPQAIWDRYRLDFAVLSHGPQCTSRLMLAIECDGHDFHERTKEQAARDKSRDRDLLLGGWQVMRFTGSEIYADAGKCVDQIAEHIQNWIGERVEEWWERQRRD